MTHAMKVVRETDELKRRLAEMKERCAAVADYYSGKWLGDRIRAIDESANHIAPPVRHTYRTCPACNPDAGQYARGLEMWADIEIARCGIEKK